MTHRSNLAVPRQMVTLAVSSRQPTAHATVKPMPWSKIRPPKTQQVVPVAQAPTNSGTKTAPFLALSRCGFVDSQRLTQKREPPAVPKLINHKRHQSKPIKFLTSHSNPSSNYENYNPNPCRRRSL